MKLSRMFIYDQYKGMRDYLKTQKNYEIARTILYFAISLTLFVAGWIATGKRENLLTVVAVLGCLPACKSMVDMIMFLKHKGCSPEDAPQKYRTTPPAAPRTIKARSSPPPRLSKNAKEATPLARQ